MSRYGIMLICLLSINACGQVELDPMHFVQWIEDAGNGFVKVKEISGIRYTAQMKPLDYIIAKEMRTNNISNETRSERRKKLDGLTYYNLKYSSMSGVQDIMKQNLSSSGEYGDRIQYFSFGFEKDIYMVQGSDTIPCAMFQFVRSHGIPPVANFVVAFEENIGSSVDQQLVIHDRVYGNGLIKFFFSQDDLSELPKMKCIDE